MADLAARIFRLREAIAEWVKRCPCTCWDCAVLGDVLRSDIPELLRAAETWQRVLEVSVDSSVRTLSALGARVGMLIEDARALPLTGAPAWWMDRDQALAAPAPPPARTAEQERVRTVDFMRQWAAKYGNETIGGLTRRDEGLRLADIISRGEHWPETGEERDRG